MARRGLPRAALERVRDALAPGGRVVRVRPLRGGVSSSVHLVRLEASDGVRQAVVVRRYGEYWQRTDPSACEREFKILEVLVALGFPAPTPLLLDADGGPFGAPTVVMTRLPGRIVLDPRDQAEYIRQSAGMLARLHALPATDLPFLRDQRVVVERTLTSYGTLELDDLERSILTAATALWPSSAGASQHRTIVHGDYWPGNLLWQRGRLSGVIDWEQPVIGDPVRDVATCRGDLSVLFGLEAADDFLQHYLDSGGMPVEGLRFWDLLISTWAVRQIEAWAIVYPLFGRAELTPAVARERVRAFAWRALRS